MNPADRRRIHGPLVPMDRETTLSRWGDLIDQRPADEPHPLFGVIILAGLLGMTVLCLGALFLMIGVF